MTSLRSIRAAIERDPALLPRLLAVADAPARHGDAVNTPEKAVDVVWPLLAGRGTEALICVALDRKHRVLSVTTLTTGNDGFTVVCPRQIYRWALMQGRSGASAILLAHNHPSGDVTPSQQDRDVTRRVAAAGRVLGIPLLDHLVVADGPGGCRWHSLAQDGELPTSWVNTDPICTAP